jgi:hypothetical protein
MIEEDRQHIEDSILDVNNVFLRAPNVLLTEEDLRMHLCHRLITRFGTEETTNDGDTSISLHTEVRWYGKGNLKTRSDVVLVDVSNLDVKRHAALPSKGYGFNMPKAIIELKFRRPNGEPTPTFLKKIEQDLEKLQELVGVFHAAQGLNTVGFWMLVFDKKADIRNRVNELTIPSGVRMIYTFADSSEQRNCVSAYMQPGTQASFFQEEVVY